MELYLIRHGEAAGDPHRHCEVPVEGYLSENGVQQAAAIGAALAGVQLTHIYASPLGRAIQTAQAVAAGREVEINLVEWLKEWQPATVLGRCEETQWEEIERAANALRPEMAWESGAGESTFEFAGRVIPNLIRLLTMHGAEAAHGGYLLSPGADGQKIAIVAHGGTLMRISSFLLGIPLAPYTPFSFEHTGTAVFRFQRRVDVWYPVMSVRPWA